MNCILYNWIIVNDRSTYKHFYAAFKVCNVTSYYGSQINVVESQSAFEEHKMETTFYCKSSLQSFLGENGKYPGLLFNQSFDMK